MAGGSKVQTTRSEPWEEQKPYLTEGFKRAEEAYSGGQMAPAYYGTYLDASGKWKTDTSLPTLAGFTGAETEAQQMALDYARNPQTEQFMGDAQQGMGDMLLAGRRAMTHGATAAQPLTQDQYSTFTPYTAAQYGDLLSGTVDTDTGPFRDVADVYGRQAMSQLTGNVLPGIRSAITQSQAGGGTRGDIVQANAIAAANQQMTDNIAKAQFDAYNQAQAMRMPAAQMGLGAQQFGMGYGLQGLQGAQGALGMYPGMMQAPLGMFGAAQGIGEQQRALTQAALNRDIARYEYQSQLPQQGLQSYLAGVSGDYGGLTTSRGPGGTGGVETAIAALIGSMI